MVIKTPDPDSLEMLDPYPDAKRGNPNPQTACSVRIAICHIIETEISEGNNYCQDGQGQYKALGVNRAFIQMHTIARTVCTVS